MIQRKYLVILGVLVVVAIVAAGRFDEYAFNDITAQAVMSLLTPLFIIALFVERAQEVFISAWREPAKRKIESRVEALKKRPGATSEGEPAQHCEGSESELARYKAGTQRVALVVGLTTGVLISVAGVRVLHPLVNWDADIVGLQNTVFDTVDIFVTGGLLGGGSEGIHKLVSVITDFLDFTRNKIQGKA